MSNEKSQVGEMSLGKRMRELREAKEMKLGDVEKLSGARASTLSDIENGRIKNPAFSTIEAVSRALGVSPIYFCENTIIMDNEKITAMLPESIKEALLSNNFLPYLVVIEKAFRAGIPHEVVSMIIDTIRKGKGEEK